LVIDIIVLLAGFTKCYLDYVFFVFVRRLPVASIQFGDDIAGDFLNLRWRQRPL